MIAYDEFLTAKSAVATSVGYDGQIATNPILKPHQEAIARWAVRGGRRAIFADFGLGKSVMQIQIAQALVDVFGGSALIVCPLGVRQEFMRDAYEFFGIDFIYVRTNDEHAAATAHGRRFFLTNYERVRDGDLDPNRFTMVSLDEASVLRSFGSKTYQTFLSLFEQVRFRFVCTATPSPNRFKELIHYAAFLGVMDSGQALTRFFMRDSEQAGNLRLFPHKEAEFYAWLSSWAIFLTKPSDLGFSDEGYDLPELRLHEHRLATDHVGAGFDNRGQAKLLKDAAISLPDAAREKRDSLADRIATAKAIIDAAPPDQHWIIWHDLEDERRAIEAAFPDAVTVYGSQDLDEREQRIIDFSDGKYRVLAVKPSIAGSGCNFQRHCHAAIYLGVGYKFNDWWQSVHRLHRFLQAHPVDVEVIYTEAEAPVWSELRRKWAQHDELRARMSEIIRTHGLDGGLRAEVLQRQMGVARREVRGERWTAVNNDTVLEAPRLTDGSVDLIVTSWPFSDQYEYTPTFNDFGHNAGDDPFLEQMNYLTPELVRALAPGRIYAVHAKDRIVFGSVSGDGMYSVNPFSDKCVAHLQKHGLRFVGRITIVTDVVRENNQTYRLGWSEQCKDGTKMGCGMSEYVLLFRKLPSDLTRSYADVPVKHAKADYSRARWQFDAHGMWRSSGDRFLTPEEIRGLDFGTLRKLWHEYSRSHVYDFKEHVAIAETLEAAGYLPSSFMLLDPTSHDPMVWDDIVRMRTLNGEQTRRQAALHTCLRRGSLILTRDGYKPIESVSLGDHVLTHKGRWRPVLAVQRTGAEDAIVRVRAQGVPDLHVTPDHKLWTRDPGDYARPADRARKVEPDWVPAADVRGAYVNLKLPPTEPSAYSADEWWIVGRWLADGYIDQRGVAHIAVGSHKVDSLRQRLGERASTVAGEGTSLKVALADPGRRLREVFERCGRLAHGKSVPGDGLVLDTEKSKALLDGYLSGDGHLEPNRKRWMATSVSKSLLLGLAILAQRAYGAVASIYAGRPAGTATIEGRVVNTKQEWVFSFDIPDESRYRGRPFILDDGAWKKVRSVESAGVAETWNLRVADDESFTAEGCIVKNCPLQLDIVERLIERYSNPGDLVLDPFGGLGTVAYMAVKMGRRGYTIELSPEYHDDAVGYLRAAEAEMPMPSLFDVVADGAA